MLIAGSLVAEQAEISHPILEGEVYSSMEDRELMSGEHNKFVELATRHPRLLMPGAETTESSVFARTPEACSSQHIAPCKYLSRSLMIYPF
jgi:hypothetical protein